jgi:hypothetical protein
LLDVHFEQLAGIAIRRGRDSALCECSVHSQNPIHGCLSWW